MIDAVGHGVTLFYILSAYCLMLSFSRIQKNPSWTDYGIRRIFRIAPAFYLAIIVWRFIPLPDGHPHADTFLLLTSLSFTNGFFPSAIHSAIPHGWSIAVETSFYLLLIPLFYHIRSLFSAALLLMIVLPLSLGISWGLPYLLARWGGKGIADYTVYWLPAHLPSFLMGIAAFFVVYRRSETGDRILSLMRQHKRVGQFAAIGVMALSSFFPTRLAHLVFAVGASAWIIWLSCHPKSLWVNRLARWVGMISFSAYLYHQLAINLASEWHDQFLAPPWIPPWLPQILLAAIFTAAIASVGYWAVEKPGMAASREIIKSLRKRRYSTVNPAAPY